MYFLNTVDKVTIQKCTQEEISESVKQRKSGKDKAVLRNMENRTRAFSKHSQNVEGAQTKPWEKFVQMHIYSYYFLITTALISNIGKVCLLSCTLFTYYICPTHAMPGPRGYHFIKHTLLYIHVI